MFWQTATFFIDLAVHIHKGLFINYVDRILKIFDPTSPCLRRQVYNISICSTIDIWPTPLPLACLGSLRTASKVDLLRYDVAVLAGLKTLKNTSVKF